MLLSVAFWGKTESSMRKPGLNPQMIGSAAEDSDIRMFQGNGLALWKSYWFGREQLGFRICMLIK